MRIKGVVLMAVLFASAGVVAGGDAAKEQKKFEGTWSIASAQKGGKEAPGEELKQLRFTFSGNKLKLTFGEKSMEGNFKVDPSKKPAQIDVTMQDKTAEGIYQFKDGMLELCINEPGMGGRPTEFKSKEGTMTTVIVLKREKK
jgi:uncharacterized protein (TIGR03067 family)